MGVGEFEKWVYWRRCKILYKTSQMILKRGDLWHFDSYVDSYDFEFTMGLNYLLSIFFLGSMKNFHQHVTWELENIQLILHRKLVSYKDLQWWLQYNHTNKSRLIFIDSITWISIAPITEYLDKHDIFHLWSWFVKHTKPFISAMKKGNSEH